MLAAATRRVAPARCSALLQRALSTTPARRGAADFNPKQQTAAGARDKAAVGVRPRPAAPHA
jgi:hypothetical protein